MLFKKTLNYVSIMLRMDGWKSENGTTEKIESIHSTIHISINRSHQGESSSVC